MSNQTVNDNQDFWFAKVDTDVVKDKELSITAKFIFTVLCTFADKDKRGCWPSNEKVAEAAGVSKSTVIRACKELEARGVIARSDRFKEGGQISSYTHIVGHNAPCYDGVAPMTPPSSTDDTPPVAPMTHRTRINEQDIYSLTREAPLPNSTDEPILAFENGHPVEPPKPEPERKPEEVCTPDDVPNVMKSSAELLLFKTGRKGLTWDEVSALRELSVSQYPSRVNKEIDTAIRRFLKRGQPLSELTFGYIAGSLSHQPTRGVKRKLKAPAKPAEVPACTDEQAEAEMAEIEALQAKFDREDEERRRSYGR